MGWSGSDCVASQPSFRQTFTPPLAAAVHTYQSHGPEALDGLELLASELKELERLLGSEALKADLLVLGS